MYKILAHTRTHATAAFRLAVVSCILFLAAAFSLRAQTPTRDAEIRVYYPFDNAVVREDYLSNQEALRQLDSLYKAGAFDGQETLEIVSYSSPEGQYAYNVNLSKRRAESLRRYIAAKYPSLASRLTTNPDGESWADLREAVLHDTRMSEQSREKMLQIIDSSARPDEKEARLKAISSYKQLYANYFRRLRYAFIRVRIADSGADAVPTGNTEISDADAAKADRLRMIALSDSLRNAAKADSLRHAAAIAAAAAAAAAAQAARADSLRNAALADSLAMAKRADSLSVMPADTLEISPVDTLAASPADSLDNPAKADSTYIRPKKMIAAVKTNLLYDAVTALNVEVEVPIGRHFSVMVEDVFPWWETKNKYCFQMWEMGLEGRYWFKGWDPDGREKLRGLFAGVYAMSSKYDFQWDRDINLQGEYWSAGVSAGYAMPIGRRKRVNLEFSLAVGPMHTVFRHYQPTQSYDKLIRDPYNAGIDYKTGQWYFGPTKAKVSLVVPICVPTGKKEVRHD